MKQRFVTAVVCLVVAGVMVPAATADPIHAKNATQINATCSGVPITVVVHGNGEFSPAHVVGSTSVFIPTAFDLTFTFTPTGGSPMPETDMSAKTEPIRNTVTCAIPLQTLFSGPEGTNTIEGTVTGFFTPW